MKEERKLEAFAPETALPTLGTPRLPFFLPADLVEGSEPKVRNAKIN